MKRSVSGLVLLVAMLAVGCGDGGDGGGQGDSISSESSSSQDQKPDVSNAFPSEKATAVITGKVFFDGDPPPREEVSAEKIAAAKDELCIKHHADHPLLTEDLIVSEDKAIRNVLVYVKSFPEDWTHATLEDTVSIDQKGCAYVPHVVGVMVDQPVEVSSSDDTAHNVHLVARRNRGTNFTQAKGDTKEMTFKRAEMGSAYFKCDIHSWMKSYVGVFDHPFFAVTADDGTFEFPKLPPGEYEIAAWHETLGTQTQKITLEDGKPFMAEFTFKQE